MKKERKTKEIKLPMKFNPGTQKYEPALPLKKANGKLNVQMDLRDKIIGIAIIVFFITLTILLSKYYI